MNKIIALVAHPVVDPVEILIDLNDFDLCEDRDQVRQRFYEFLYPYSSDYASFEYNDEDLEKAIDLVCDKLVDQFAKGIEREKIRKEKQEKQEKQKKLKREKQYLKLKKEFEGKS